MGKEADTKVSGYEERKPAWKVCLLSQMSATREYKINRGLFPPHLMLANTFATRLATKVPETVEKQFVTEIKMLNKATSCSARDFNYC